MTSFKNSFLMLSPGETSGQKKEKRTELVLDGYRLPDMISLHKVLKTGLKLPSYSSPNLDSLDEILNDPDWLESHGEIHLSIQNYPQFLHFEPDEKKRSFLSILDSMSTILGYNAVSIQYCKEAELDLNKMHLPYHTSPI
jgi:hypothetical protein